MEEPSLSSRERVRFGLFGGVQVVRGGAEVGLRQPKQRALLALLLSTPNEPVYASEIIDVLWSGEPSASATNQIHHHVGALRRVFQPGLERRQVGRYVLPAGTGYRLVVGVDDCDVLRFRWLARKASQFARAGNRGEARRAYIGAIAVASAPAGEDTMWALPAFVGLEDERVQAIIGAAEHCETADEVAAVLPALRAAAGRHPLNEALHTQLMTALSQAGRGTEALEVYARIRAELKDTHGSSPGAALTAAQARALRGDDSSSVRPPAEPGQARRARPAQLPSPLPGFAGRREVLASLRDNTTSHDRVLLVTGMAGVGKTTLALRYASEVASRYADGQLYVNLRGFDATLPPSRPLDALGDMLHALGVTSHALPASVDGRSGLLRSLLSERHLLVVLDNAHDYRQVEPLLPGTGASRAIVTSRSQMPALAVFHQARTIQLDPFDDGEAVEFFSQRLSPGLAGDCRDAMMRLGKACGGLPLALAIIAARASGQPGLPLDLLDLELAQERAPLAAFSAGSAELDLCSVFSGSYRGLSKDAAGSFAALSAHPGPEISAAAAVSISGVGPQRGREVLAELSLASMLREGRPGRFVFHDLIREYALTLGAATSAAASARLVNHYVRSAREAILTFGRPAIAPVDDTLPGIVAETFASTRDATAWYTLEQRVLHHACRLAFSLGDHRSALMLMLDWRPMSQLVDARHDMLPFAELAIEASGHVEADLRAECFRDVAATFARTGQPERARAYFDLAAQGFLETGSQAGQVNVRRNMAQLLTMDPRQRVGLLREAVAIARDLGDQPILAAALHGLALALHSSGQFDEELTALAECGSITAANQPGLSYLTPYVLGARAAALAMSGRLDESVTEGQRALEVTRREGDMLNELRLLDPQGDALTALGRTREAAKIWRRFLTLATPDLVQTTNNAEDDTDGAGIIDRVKAKLAALPSSALT